MIPNKDELIQLAKWAKGSIHHIYLHHTGGTYEMNAIEKKITIFVSKAMVLLS